MIKQVRSRWKKSFRWCWSYKTCSKRNKQREEAISQYRAASRDDLVQKEQEQVDVFMLYLPKQLRWWRAWKWNERDNKWSWSN